jgi:Zn-dependent metalloprotease
MKKVYLWMFRFLHKHQMFDLTQTNRFLLFFKKQLNLSPLRAGLFLLLTMCVLPSTAQRLTPQEQLQAICEPEAELEFFVIRKDLNITKEEFIEKYLHVLNLAPNSEMRAFRQETNDLGITMTRYQQYVNNIKVKGGDMVVNEQNGRVKYINGRYMTKTAINEEVKIPEESGLKTALQQINATEYLWLNPEAEANYKKLKKSETATLYPKGELCFVPERGKNEAQIFRLVWKYLINVSPATESYEVHINASTGEVVNKIPLTYDCNGGSSTTIWNGARTIFTQLNAGSYRTLGDCNSAQVHTMNGNGNDNGVGATFYTDADNSWPNTTLGNYIAQTHWGVKETRDYYASVHSREGYDDAGHDFVSYINAGFTSNAYWTYATEAASFGGSSTGASPYCNIDVCGHEHTHGVVHFTSDLVYQDEPGALNESFADCLGEAVEERTLGPTNWIHRFEISGGNRSLIDPNDFSDPDTYNGTFWYTGSGDNGGVHTNSGVQNHWFYLLSQGGTGTNDNGNSFNVSGITIDKARLITYDCMVGLSTNSQYSNARSVSIQKAKDRYGDCADEVEQTTNAWRAVGVGAAYVAPTPITITATTTATEVCKGGSVTITASGASSYTWLPGSLTGNPKTFSPNTTTTYTITGTAAGSCTGTKTVTIKVNSLPTVEPIVSDNELCPGQSTTISAGTNQTINSFLTTIAGGNGLSGNAFDIHAYNNITITDFKMHMQTGPDSVEVYYKPGGYGNTNVTSSASWFKLGATVPVTSLGSGVLTLIPTTSNLTIPAGQTYGIIILCNGSNIYTNGTSVGSIAASNPDLYITEGHGGNGGFGSAFNFTISPRVFNGTVEYRTNYISYSWSPSATLSSATSSFPTASPSSSTTYTLTATDANGCTGTASAKVYMYGNPSSGLTTATPPSICNGSTSQLNTIPFLSSSSQSLFTTLAAGNGNAANMFDVHALNNITITNVRMTIVTGDSAQVWYKMSPYGNANVTSSSGWTKLGNTVAITPAGAGALTLIPTTANLSIPAGATYGLAVICNGTNDYSNGTGVGTVAYSSPDLEITEGHGGTGFNGAFSFTAAPRIFNGQIDYTVTNNPMSYLWTPGSSLSSNTIANPIASPKVKTTYTVTLTDAHGCKDTAYETIDVNPISNLLTSISPTTICPGDSAQINIVNYIGEKDSLMTTLMTDNSNAGNAFNILTSKPTFIKAFKMHIMSGTQVEVWYKPGGYGNLNFTGTAGWTKHGSTLSITPAGAGNFTNVPLSTALSIPAGVTYGIMLVTNGTVNYLNSASSTGSVYTSNADIAITVGHGGSGIGSYNFAASPRLWNGEVVYEVDNYLTDFVWTPGSNINNTTIANPKVSPPSNTIYSVTTTDVNGCTATAMIGVNVSSLPQLGTATATPATLCAGQDVSLYYSQPPGLGCFGNFQHGFAFDYAPANWTQSLVNSNGSVNTALAPSSITLVSSNGLSGSGQTNYSVTVPCSGIVIFDWEYYSLDAGPQYDIPRYSINGGPFVNFPTFKAQNGFPIQQVGSVSIPMTAGQTLTIQAYSSDNLGGSATILIKNFKAPSQSMSVQTVNWYQNATGGLPTGLLNPQTLTPAASTTYYAQVTSDITGCTNPTRVPTNPIVVLPVPSLTTSASASIICAGTPTTLSCTGANTYTWQPGSLTGSSVIVSPLTTTIYTVTGTSVNGCTKTATITITVNPLPVISGTASPSIVCPGAPVTLTGTTPGVTWNWQPGNLSGSPVVVNPVVQTTYTVTATSAQGCTKSQTFVILMHPTPSASTTVSPSSAICAGQSATITATGGVSYLWMPGSTTGNTRVVNTAATYTVTVTNALGCTATATRVITVNPTPTVGTTITNANICLGASTTMTGTGALTYIWQPGSLTGTSVTVSPASTTTYTVTGTNASGCTNTSTRLVTVSPCGNSQLTVKVLHQGYYNGAGFMGSVLQNQGQPNGPSDCDTVEIRLYNSSSPYAMAHSYTGVLQTNGDVVCSFPPAVNGLSYYIGVRHRNAIETWSNNPVLMSALTTYNFSNALNKAYGSNQVSLGGGFFAIFNGDINQDGVVDGLDYNDWETDNNNFAGGYYSSDLNGDGIVDGLDFLIWEDNNNNFVGIITP